LKKRLISAMLAVIFILNITVVNAAANPITVVVNNNTVQFDVSPVIENGRTLVPVRAIFEALGAVVTWNANTRTAIGVKDTRTINIKIDSADATVNDIHKKLDVPARIKQNRTFIPLRFVAESLGAIVSWDGETRTVKISDNNTKVQESTQTTNFNRISIDIPNGWVYDTNPEVAPGTDQIRLNQETIDQGLVQITLTNARKDISITRAVTEGGKALVQRVLTMEGFNDCLVEGAGEEPYFMGRGGILVSFNLKKQSKKDSEYLAMKIYCFGEEIKETNEVLLITTYNTTGDYTDMEKIVRSIKVLPKK